MVATEPGMAFQQSEGMALALEQEPRPFERLDMASRLSERLGTELELALRCIEALALALALRRSEYLAGLSLVVAELELKSVVALWFVGRSRPQQQCSFLQQQKHLTLLIIDLIINPLQTQNLLFYFYVRNHKILPFTKWGIIIFSSYAKIR